MAIHVFRGLLNHSKSSIRRISNALVSDSHFSITAHDLGDGGLQLGVPNVLTRHYASIRDASAMVKNSSRTLIATRELSGDPEEIISEKEELEVTEKILDYPGAKTNFISQMQFIPPTADERVPCYRVLDESGQPMPLAELPEMAVEVAQKMYTNMVTLQAMDVIFYEAQRQGRFSFYLTTRGEEAINIAASAALSLEDMVYAQYREPGILMWRGFTVEEFADNCFGNSADLGKGRQMPVHYGSRQLKCPTVSSTIATQLPQAVGAAYALKMAGTKACTVTFFGDGGSSEGDFHGALNFAATLETPTVFICRNNGWAISTSVKEQFRSDGVVVKGRAYGVRSIRVDGNDALAVYATVKAARKMAIEESQPVLIEALTYRTGHHSTSDDSSKYRKRDEIEHWRTQRDPVLRFKRWIEAKGWWDVESETQLRAAARKEVIAALTKAGSKKKPELVNLFTDVYDIVPPHLRAQERQLRDTIAMHPNTYPKDVPL